MNKLDMRMLDGMITECAEKIASLNDEIKDFVTTYGKDPCDYLDCRISRSYQAEGSMSALLEFKAKIKAERKRTHMY